MPNRSDDFDPLLVGAVVAGVAVLGAVGAIVGGPFVAARKAARLLKSRHGRNSDVGDPATGSGRRRPVEVQFDIGGRPSPGVLKQMGYHVGRNGLEPWSRRDILETVYEAKLMASSADERAYIREFGVPGSHTRARKMERVLAGFIANAKHRDADMSEAIADWKSDLAWLRERYNL